ncbi:TIGR00282 family metallophosphoesterase [Azospirillum sp. BE72]|uniref:TIGR00282 family metallophosphoesterase n=1 Tax=Azospirillum sp. BE72 TaxID=2817776 RepID=UPI00286758D5|nr:TIGR00282 family metallophosphoesterase [Azospirillum sp. BE72]MDR6771190.1 metallophosphoesterase (TIGR00282 family) [Azospirillum sp. BE72]
MRILFFGDVVGRAGRDAVLAHMPMLRERLDPDLTVVNGENSAGGYGVTVKIAEEFFAAGIDVVTLGNHTWDQKELVGTIEQQPRIIRPLNYPEGTPGRGFVLLQARGGRKVLVVNVLLRLFMEPMDDPFAAVDRVLKAHRLGPGGVDAVLVDMHGEATSEKMIMGHFCDGRASLVVGTHSHVPTADHMVLPKGTAYQSDAGMCGDYDSAIGMKKEVALAKMVRKLPTERLSPAEGEGTVCGCYVETDDRSGLAVRIEPLRIGGRLSQTLPERMQ